MGFLFRGGRVRARPPPARCPEVPERGRGRPVRLRGAHPAQDPGLADEVAPVEPDHGEGVRGDGAAAVRRL